MVRRLLFRWLFLPGLHFGGAGILAGLVELYGGRPDRQVLAWEVAAARDLLESLAVTARAGGDPGAATDAWLHRWWTWSGAATLHPAVAAPPPLPRPGAAQLAVHLPVWAVPAAELFAATSLLVLVLIVLTRPPMRRALGRAGALGRLSAGALARQTVSIVSGRSRER